VPAFLRLSVALNSSDFQESIADPHSIEDTPDPQIQTAYYPAEESRLDWLYRTQCLLSQNHATFEASMTDSELYKKGDAVRRELLGDAAYERNNRNYADPIMREFLNVCTETVFGGLWARPGLDLKSRTLVCVVSDVATGREPELAIHLRFALGQGWTEDELTEVLLQLMGYVGAPLVRGALMVAKRTFAEIRAESGA
jgi:4-carboxymuconolactone decarboxylase